MIKKLVSPVISLVSICVIATLLLSFTHFITAPVISENAEKAAEQARYEVLPESDGFTKMTDVELADNVTEVYISTNGSGYAITSTVGTDAGDITVITGIDLLGSVSGIRITDSADGKVIDEVLSYSDVYISAMKTARGSTARINRLISSSSGDAYSASDVLSAVSAAIMETDYLGGDF